MFERFRTAIRSTFRAHRGAILAALATMFWAACVGALNLQSGFGLWADFLFAFSIALIGVPVAALLMAGLLALLRLLPRLLTGFLLAAGLFISLLWFDTEGWVLAALLLVVECLLGASLFHLRHPSLWKRSAAWSVLVLTLGANIYFFRLLHSDGITEELIQIKEKPLPALAAADPSRRGPYAVKTLYYGSGDSLRRPEFGPSVAIRTRTVDASPFFKKFTGWKPWIRKRYWGFGMDKLPLNGRVFYPDGTGPFPLFLIVHGNHEMSVPSDNGYAYLCELLASRGFIAVSVDENFLNSGLFHDPPGQQPVRGWLLLEHLRLWHEWSRNTKNPFYGKVDLNNIALGGHSRGGEAAATAALFNKLEYDPDDANIRFHYGYGIKSVVAIAPPDGQYKPAQQWRILKDVNYFTLEGANDADVSEFQGSRQYDHVHFSGNVDAFKSELYIYRANHGQFNTMWGRTDIDVPSNWFLNLRPLLKPEDQRQIAEVYISAFLEVTLRGHSEYRDVFRDYRRARQWLPDTLYVNRYQDQTYQTICSFDEDADLTTTTAPGGHISASGLKVWREAKIPFRSGDRDYNGVFIGWIKAKKPATYTVDLPPGVSGQALALSVAATDDDPQDKDGDEDDEKNEVTDFSIEAVSTNGTSARVALNDFHALLPPLHVQFTKLERLDSRLYKNSSEPNFQTVHIPFSAFGMAPGTIARIRLIFDKTPARVIIISGIGLEGGLSKFGRRSVKIGSVRAALNTTDFSPSFGLTFQDLYSREGILKLDGIFLDSLHKASPDLHARLLAARENPPAAHDLKGSELIIAAAPYVEDFLGELFGIETELRHLQAKHHVLAPLYAVKRKFVQRKALTGYTPESAAEVDGFKVCAELEALMQEPLTELTFATHVARWLDAPDQHVKHLQLATQYTAWATLSPQGKAKHGKGVLFKVPHKLDMAHLVPVHQSKTNGLVTLELTQNHWRNREGFDLTDAGTDLTGALDQANYCIKCHHQAKDSCSTGLKEKTGAFKSSVFGVTLNGCPLDEKISEMHELKGAGNPIGALAVVTIDNPMAAGTGHRICNDCMKSCIFQKQEPVDIPQAETRTLKDVLELPWGFEIYSLLTRWNPLNFARPVPRAATGYKVLVVGLGPAGFTLSHHLMNDGHTVSAVDGLKIEPLPEDVSGVNAFGDRVPFRPLRDITEIYERLDERVNAGFGGVAEYGITIRWNKNFLKVIRLLLERRSAFSMFGGVRFGGTMTVDSAFEMGFDHIALCAGAGRPTVIPMKNGLVRGVRQASDFLMALQLTGAAKKDSLANLQIRMPIVVIGGGLTAVDTATESLAYYVVQVEKFLQRYRDLTAELGERAVQAMWNPEEAGIAQEFLEHARAIEAERAAAKREGRSPDLITLLQKWGGSTIAYRRRLIDAPSYTLNHEEVAKAMEEGVRFAECLAPEEVEVDQYNCAVALRLERQHFDEATGKLKATGERIVIPARTILVAAGTQPNTVLAREDEHNFSLDGRYFQAVDEAGEPVRPERVAKPGTPQVLVSKRPDGRAISFFGDLHPSFSGNVVKAMGSAKQGYPVISRVLAKQAPHAPEPAVLSAKLNQELRAVVEDVIRLTPNIIEIVVKAPIAARAFQPGQFYRLQNYESLAARTEGTVLAMEGLALTGASVNQEKGLLSTIVLEMGGSSDLCSMLKPGEPVILMGPTGTPTETPGKETVLLAGGGLGNAVLFSIGQQLRASGSRVVYFAGYKKIIDRYKIEEIEKAADVVIWVCDEAPGFTPTRALDSAFVGNIVQAMEAYGKGELGEIDIPLSSVDRLIVIGSDGMMRAVQQARHSVLRPYLKPDHQAIGSINSPMQCMMKEICAQCLQMHKDPVTGKETVVFSCFNQDQPLDLVEFGSLRSRLTQNGTQEKLTKLWIDRCLRGIGARPELVNR